MNNEEDAMKKFIALGMAAVLTGTCLHAQLPQDMVKAERSTLASLHSYQTCDLQRLERSLLISLRHKVEGVVVGTLREVAKIKLAQPECTSETIAGQVADLVQRGATPSIRYKAYLTGIILSSPISFSAEGVEPYQSDEQFFTAVARRLETIALRDER